METAAPSPRPGDARPIASLLRALRFAAAKHRDQKRKGEEAAPYVNHLIEVAALLADAGVEDPVTLQAAVLHDTVEDTDTTPAELEAAFGAGVAAVVVEVTDDRRLPKARRKALQVEHAPGLSERAKLVKIADKISNVRAVAETPPAGWPLERRVAYLDWSERVVAGCRGASPALEAVFDRTLASARRTLAAVPDAGPLP